ncbi:MAG: hypothetical protein ACEQR7_10680 [Agathobacter rectalis]
MAARFWVGGTGNLDGSDTSHIAATSGGTPGASYPGSGDDLTLDANSGGGTVTMTAAVNMNSLTYGQFTGTLLFNGQAVTTVTHTISGTGTRAINWGSSIITVTGSGGTPFNGATITGLTFTRGTSKLILSGASITLSAGSLTLYDIEVTGAGIHNLNFPACHSFTRTGTAAKTDGFMLSQSINVTEVLTLNANSLINRLFIRSTTIGTARTITAASLVCTNVIDFKDITGAGAATWTTAASGATYFGDCGGNSGITMTAAVSQSPSNVNGFNWDTATWTSRVPLPQDPVVVNTALGLNKSIACNMPRLGKDIDFSGLTWTGTMGLNLGSTANELYGSLTLKAGFTMSGTNPTTLAGRGSYNITSAGNIYTNIFTIEAPGGTYTLQDAYVHNGTGRLQVNNGSFIDGNFNITADNFNSANSNVRTITLGTGTITLTGTATLWNIGTVTNLTFSGSLKDIIMSNANATTKAFAGGGLTYGTLTYNISSSTGQLAMSGNNSFSAINFSDANNARILNFTAANTNTIRNLYGFNVKGKAGKLMTIQSQTAATHTLSSSLNQKCDYVNIINSIATGGGEWHAGPHSTDGGGNTGWRFNRIKSIGGVAIAALKSVRGVDIENARSMNGNAMDA